MTLKNTDQQIHDFIQLIHSKFEKLEQESDENLLRFQVSPKETLSITYENDDNTSDYNFRIFLEKKEVFVEISGTLKSQKQKKRYIQSLNDKTFLEELNTLKYAEEGFLYNKETHSTELLPRNINHSIMLFGLSKKEKFIRGKLKHWDRIDGRIIQKDDLGRIMKRKRNWEKEHPSTATNKKRIQYKTTECRKANCSNLLSNNECKLGLNPINNKEERKLAHATGYCYEYISQENSQLKNTLENELLFPISLEEFSFYMRINRFIRQLRKITILPFNHTAMRPFFSRKKLKELMELQYEHLHKHKKTFFKHIQDNKAEIQTKFAETRILVQEYIERRTTNQAFKKAYNNYNKERNETISHYHEQLSTAKRLLKKIKRQNELITQLFEEPTKEHISVFGTFIKDSLVYFPSSKITEVRGFHGNKTKNHLNIGRERLDRDWHDIHLSPIGEYSYSTSKPFYPIYRVISVKKSEVALQQLFTKREIRLLAKREYIAYNLHPRRILPQATLNCVKIIIIATALILNSQKKPAPPKQITLTSFL